MKKVKLKSIKKLTICSLPVSVVQSDPEEWNMTGMGRSAFKEGRILINKAMDEERKKWIAFHEALHHIADMHEIELSEQDASTLSAALFSFIRENPKFIKGLLAL